MTLDLIDTHCHLTTVAPNEVDALIARAAIMSVHRMICIGAGDGALAAEQAVALAERYPNVWASVGIHPHDAAADADLESIARLATHPKVVAIGETGLDFFRDWSPIEEQYRVFRAMISLAKKVNKPLIIHCREAGEDTLCILREETAEKVGGVFHCYAESGEFATKLQTLRFLVSFTGNITFKKADALRKTVSEIPLEQMMTETDSPYMAPEPHRGKPSEPMHVYYVAEQIAQVKNVSLEEVARITTATAEKLFRLPSFR